MKAMQAELKRIFKKNPVGIIFVLTLDIAEIVCLSLNPLVIGLCIDGFFERSYFWLYVLILLQLLLIVVRTINKFSDNRVYEPIIEDERNSYYERGIAANVNESELSSRLDLVVRIPEFFENGLVEILDMFGGIFFSLVSLYISAATPLLAAAGIISILIFAFTHGFHKEIVQNNKRLQDSDEKREGIILTKEIVKYRLFSMQQRNFRIKNSDLEAKAYLLTDILQAILLIFAVIYALHFGDYTSGEVFTIITYIIMLNESVCMFNEAIIEIADLEDVVIRLREGRNEF